MTARSECFINGIWRSGGGEEFAAIDPAHQGPVWEGQAADEVDVADAVAAARASFALWSRRPFEERRTIVLAYKSALEARREAFARLIALETGKPAWECAGEVAAMIAKVEISLAAYQERTGERASDTAFGQARLSHKPHGVMAVLGPYNFPGHLPNGHIVPALIAGDTVVFKPSELTPSVGAAMVEAWHQAGLPQGALNLVQGGRETGAALLDAAVDGVLFTGSVDTGVMIHRKFAGRPDVILALEMGGNNPLVVWDVADAEAAAVIALQSAFITSGQRCSCARRLIIPHGERGERVLTALVDLVGRIRIGPPDGDPEPFMGPLVNAKAAEGVLNAQARLREEGGTVILAAKRGAGPAFLTPGLIDVTGIEVEDREVFGPLLSVYRELSFDAAIGRANATKFGLSAGLVSDDAALWARFHREIRAGIVNWNRPTTGAASSMPFGGPGYSGNHRPSAYYAADYCAYPVATQEASTLARLQTQGLAD